MVRFMVHNHILSNNLISLIVYFEVPEGKREKVKHRFENYILTIILLVNTYSSPHIPGTATFLNKCGDIIKLSSHFISGDDGLEPNNLLLTASL
jgi:hypothetical protein